MEEEKPNSPIALIIASIAATLVIGWLLIYKPSEKVKVNPDNADSHVDEVEDIASDQTVELDAEIVVAERRDNDYYVQVQTNGTFGGTCTIALEATEKDERIEHSAVLEPADRVSTCESYFPLKGLDSGKYKVVVLVTTKDGHTKELSKTVEIE